MRLRLIPREESFFDLFEKLAATVSLGAEELLAVLSDFTDVERKTQRVLDIEHEGDELTHEVIRRLENEGDRFYRRTIAELFSGDHRAMDVLKYKEIIEEIEAAMDRLEDVANMVESIVLKQ